MTRTRASARAAGARFERSIADHLAARVSEFVDRRVKTGAKDRGDIANLRSTHGLRIVVECKDTARLELSQWRAEAELEAGNDDAPIALVVHKRRGHGKPGEQWVTCTVDDLVTLLTGESGAPAVVSAAAGSPVVSGQDR